MRGIPLSKRPSGQEIESGGMEYPDFSTTEKEDEEKSRAVSGLP